MRAGWHGWMVCVMLGAVGCQVSGAPVRTAGGAPVAAVGEPGPSGEPGPVRRLPDPVTPAQPATPPVASALPAPEPNPAPAPWLMYGDSLTEDAFREPAVWKASWSGQAPAAYNGGMRGATAAYAVSRLDEYLTYYRAARTVGLAFGTNDANRGVTPPVYRVAMAELVTRIMADGRRPMLATVAYSPLPMLTALEDLNAVVEDLTQAYDLPPGPDLYGWFREHPEAIGPDGIHMTDEGNAAIQRLWAEAIQRAAPAGTN